MQHNHMDHTLSLNSVHLRSVVAETTAQIAQLQEKRQNAQRQLDSIVYPVLTLPPEITSEIFLHCLPTSYTDREWNSVESSEAPMLLSHVCRRWREVAISTHALWAAIEFNAPSPELFTTWLERAGGYPLALNLHG
ncbi:hypothetical protein FB451DRAFT_1023911 [Mycena latifolia]|nr:hypothetical protein FB451DRAFT_1023911 [Mycena latifolia]